jgi:biofilm PGA synthesis lipoprotein PgaB
MRLNMHRVLAALLFLVVMPSCHAASENLVMKPGEFLVLCYHSIPVKTKPGDDYSIPQHRFAEQIDYLKTHGYHPVSVEDILQAHEGKKKLPEKPVLLTFDDGYVSYYDFVVPLLEKYGYPSMLAVESTFITNPPKDLPEKVMSWDQIRELAKKELVHIASHTYDLHGAIQYNPVGNVGPMVNVRAYYPDLKRYETEEEYRARIEKDFRIQDRLFREKLGFSPTVIVWPHGKHNAISWEIARKAGYRLGFTLEWGLGNIEDLHAIDRVLIENEPIEDFIAKVTKPGVDKTQIRAVQIDLDKVYDPESFEKTDEKLGRLIDRLYEMKVNTVYLQAFADPEGTGNIKSVYFPNRVLPVRADIFSHAVHQLIIRDFTVYAWMPSMGIVLPDEELNKQLRVREVTRDGVRLSQSWYHRLSPFSEDAKKRIQMLYEDLAAHAQIDGILFQDDVYLTDKEDFHPDAIADYQKQFGSDLIELARTQKPQADMDKWTDYKTRVLIDFTKDLMESVRKYRPEAFFARNIYASVVTKPESEEWFAQNYWDFLDAYDYVVIMAYPQMEKVWRPIKWLREMADIARSTPQGLKKTVFKIQTYDWKRDKWIKEKYLLEELRTILASGGRHLAYYPDDYRLNKPELAQIKLEMSTRDYPDR